MSKPISSDGSKDRGWMISPGERHVEEKITVREKLRPRFWFAAVLNCNGAGIDLDSYDLEFRNHDESQFGVEVYGMLPMYSVFFCLFCCAQALLLWGIKEYRTTASLHPMLTLMIIAGEAEFVAVISSLIHFGLYDVNGVGSGLCTMLHEACDDAFSLAFLLLVMLIGQGWTITFPTIQEKKPVLLSLAGLTICQLMLFGWERWGRDPGLTSFRFQSFAGYLFLALRLGCAGYFCYSLHATYQTENRPDKRTFYVLFGGMFGVWLASAPVVVAIGLILDPWVRFKWVEGLLTTCNSVALSAMAYLLWPTRINEYFRIEGTTAQLAGAAPYDEI